MLMARDRIITIVKSEIVLSIIINILARRVSGKASVGLKAGVKPLDAAWYISSSAR